MRASAKGVGHYHLAGQAEAQKLVMEFQLLALFQETFAFSKLQPY
jgi:hypothetical protein